MALLVNNKTLVREKKIRDQLGQKAFGEKTDSGYVLDLCEALYLLGKKKIDVEAEETAGKGKNKKTKVKKLKFDELLALAGGAEKGFYQKYVVYADLRERGYCVKTGFKFGFDFRVYPRGMKPGQAHTQWVVNVSAQNEKYGMPELSRMVRLSGNLKALMLQAVVDAENDINYYEIKRITP
ncbi:MAG: tRNA-intron lyase [Candidatus Diapherotrites archaeon]|nr:tRNA-intron lyase [Candidatus Micrarchaeota archaeon]MBU1939889.1 tRNA-intron lyase [Candidatus Micrarchaeota archaeon]